VPRGKQTSKPPEFGHVVIGFPDANGAGTLLEVSETIRPNPGEGREEFLVRLKKQLGIGHAGDKVRIVYRDGKPQYANVTRGAYDMTPAAPTPTGSPTGKMSSWEKSFWRLYFRSPNETL